MTASPRRARAARAPASTLGRGDLGASLVLVFPLLLAYEIGVLFAGHVNGADLVTRALYALAGGRVGYLLVHAALALGFLVWIRRRGRWGTLRVEVALPVLLEAAVYALTLGAAITLVLRLVGLDAGGAPGLGLDGDSLVSAVGAGVHEELVFRLGLIGAGVWLLRGVDPRLAVPLVVLASSLLFAAAHHVGAHGEPVTVYALAFRTLAGIAFAAMFWFRSLAHAVYAHVLYDLAVAI
jgi:hypothetical protein